MKAPRFLAAAVLLALLAPAAACVPARNLPVRAAAGGTADAASPIPPEVRADPAAVLARLAELRDSVHAAAARLGPHLPEARALADSAAADIGFMLGRRGWDRDMPAEYLRGLDEVIQGLASADPAADPEAAASVFRAAVEEIRIRADQCRATPRGLGGLIAVEARVLRGGRLVPREWEIYYLRKILQHAPGARPSRFNRLAPGSEHLSPGVYRVWARHPATQRLTEQHDLKVRRADVPVVWELSVP